MLVSIGTYDICDGTLSGGVAIGELRLAIARGFDIAIPINELSPVLFDRNTSKTDITFQVYRTHGSIEDSEDFLLELEETLPRTGDVVLTSQSGEIRYIVNAAIVDFSLIKETGATTLHQYHIIGGPTSETPSPVPPPVPAGFHYRFVEIEGPPGGVKLQVKNSSDVWEDVWEYTAST